MADWFWEWLSGRLSELMGGWVDGRVGVQVDGGGVDEWLIDWVGG